MMIRLPWYENGDRLQVAIAANAIARAGYAVYRAMDNSPLLEKGDYLFAESTGSNFAEQGLVTQHVTVGDDYPLQAIYAPRIALLAGACSGYPYYGYYALALLRLGYVFTIVDGEDIAKGCLDVHDLLVLPGGFSNWTLDLKEKTQGADDAVRRFLLRGGTVLGSCGGAYYLSRGRPGWLGVADARPYNTQEYLRTGVGILTCSILDERLGLGLPPTLEVAYFHGPVWDVLGDATDRLMEFRDYYGHGRLFIDNALTREIFERDMRGCGAALRTQGRRGHSILFSPHPEMGDLLRKYMSLETYIPRYQDIRGDLVMRETLATYRPDESRSFLLILNAIEQLTTRSTTYARPETVHSPVINLQSLGQYWMKRVEAFQPSAQPTGRLEQEIVEDLKNRFESFSVGMVDHWQEAKPDLKIMACRLVDDMALYLQRQVGQRPAEILLELELTCLLLEAWSINAASDRWVR